ncbi:hypothetical protein EON73_04185 [bacterium]|nr:MAG: hypothetical protein EON73_04185 [bacterium]
MQNHNGIKASFDRGDHRVNVELNILSFEEDGIKYVYSPALDLTGYGISDTEAQKSFETVLEEFIHYTDNKKTIYKELERLGWTVNAKKKRVQPPADEQMLEYNETYRDLKKMPNVYSSKTKIGLALV